MGEQSFSSEDIAEKCSTWLESCSLDSCETSSCLSEASCSSDVTSSSNTTDNSAMQSGFSFSVVEPTVGNMIIERRLQGSQSQVLNLTSVLGQNKIPENSKIQIYKSKKVHIGDVNYIQGPVYVNGISEKEEENGKNRILKIPGRIGKNGTGQMCFFQLQESSVEIFCKVKDSPCIEYGSYIAENFRAVTNGFHVTVNAPKLEKIHIQAPFFITERKNWLAQPPLERNYLDKPAKHVIICHSATEEAFTIADNILLVRLIQSFHMDSRKWSDIGYNFLIGSDGSIFEGRGWNLVGAHTREYNMISVGICFIGTFIRKIPSSNALVNAKKLIEHGVSIGAIDKDYSLLGHCQCIGSDSPGEALFNEIKTWDNFDATISLRNPSFALPSLRNIDRIFVP